MQKSDSFFFINRRKNQQYLITFFMTVILATIIQKNTFNSNNRYNVNVHCNIMIISTFNSSNGSNVNVHRNIMHTTHLIQVTGLILTHYCLTGTFLPAVPIFRF